MNETNKSVIFLLLAIGFMTVLGGMFIAHVSINAAVASLAAVLLIIICFVNTEIGLYILIVAMLLGPQFGVSGGDNLSATRSRGLTLRFDDFLLLVIGTSWFAKAAIKKELGLFLKTPLNRPIACYFIVCVVSTMLGVMMERVKPASGFFFVMKYFEYFIVRS